KLLILLHLHSVSADTPVRVSLTYTSRTADFWAGLKGNTVKGESTCSRGDTYPVCCLRLICLVIVGFPAGCGSFLCNSLTSGGAKHIRSCRSAFLAPHATEGHRMRIALIDYFFKR